MLVKPAAAVAIAVTAAGVAGAGVGVAATRTPPTYRACSTSKHVLTLATAKGRCAKGTHPVNLSTQGPAGPPGATGPQGLPGATGTTGPKGDTGPAGNPNTTAFDSGVQAPTSGPIYLDVATVGGLTLQMACEGVAATGATFADLRFNSIAVNASGFATVTDSSYGGGMLTTTPALISVVAATASPYFARPGSDSTAGHGGLAVADVHMKIDTGPIVDVRVQITALPTLGGCRTTGEVIQGPAS
jgi:hypothetical protein